MGKISSTINHYLSDNRRFADLFNGICFRGETVVLEEDLADTSPVYHGISSTAGKNPATCQIKESETHPKRSDRTRDICKQLKNCRTVVSGVAVPQGQSRTKRADGTG